MEERTVTESLWGYTAFRQTVGRFDLRVQHLWCASFEHRSRSEHPPSTDNFWARRPSSCLLSFHREGWLNWEEPWTAWSWWRACKSSAKSSKRRSWSRCPCWKWCRCSFGKGATASSTLCLRLSHQPVWLRICFLVGHHPFPHSSPSFLFFFFQLYTYFTDHL